MPSSRLREPHLIRPTRSVRVVAEPNTAAERAAAFRVALPDDCVFSHVTAAQLWGLSLPARLQSRTEVDVMRASTRTRIRRTGCRGHKGLERRRRTATGGVPVTGLADTWVDLGELVQDGLRLDDLVILGDEVATRLMGPPEPGGTSDPRTAQRGVQELARVLEARMRPRGKRVLAQALDLVRAPVRSPMETRSRLMFVRAGFPEPVVNEDVHGEDGQWLLEGDLVWREQGVIGEYQGSDHASIKRRSYDASRLVLARDEGWQVFEIYAEDVYRVPRRVACLRRFATALGIAPATLDIR